MHSNSTRTRWMSNTYRVNGDVAYLMLANRSGEIVGEAMIDAGDLDLARKYRWSLDGSGYVTSTSSPHGVVSKQLLHRHILGCVKGDGKVVDHINRNKLDNRRANLRIGDNALNAGNRDRKASSQYPGVTWSKGTGRWLAQGTINGQHHFLGRYDSEIEAAQVYLKWRERHGLPPLADPDGRYRRAIDWKPKVRSYNRYTSKYIGVGYCKQTGKWKVQLMDNGKSVWLGRHDTEEKAAAVAGEWLRKHGRPTLRAVDRH